MRHTSSAHTAVSSHRAQSVAGLLWALPSSQAVASRSPITTGAMPCLKARTLRRSRLRWPQRVASQVSVVLGSMMPTMLSTMPRAPLAQPAGPAPPALMPTFQPSSAMNSTLGPGAAWAMAMEALNCRSVSQPWRSTRKRCMSGAVAMAPPTASSEIEM